MKKSGVRILLGPFEKDMVMITNKDLIILRYPPDYYGELHINFEKEEVERNNYYHFRFTVGAKGDETSEEALYRVAQDILRRLCK